jgi:uncharacterized repeat protein (TIGR01451 family)
VNAFLGRCEGTALILDDDILPHLSISDVTVLEGNTGTTPAAFNVSLSAPSERLVSVDFATADGTALAPADYQPTQGTLQFLTATNSSVTGTGPKVSILRSQKQVAISWPNMFDGFELQTQDALGRNVPWMLLPSVPTLSGTEYGILTDTAGPRRFFRLTHPLLFAPGETNQTIVVLVNGNQTPQPDRLFYVNLENPVNATLNKSQGVGTIVDDDRANAPPSVRITSPENQATFLPGSDIVVDAVAADSDGRVVRVDFYADTTLIGTATQEPFSVTWSKVATLGNYQLTAKATDDQGASTTSVPVVITVANVVADVAIIRNFADPEITTMQNYLFELGLTYYVFDQETVTFEALKDFKLVIWDDLGKAVGGLRDQDVDIFQSVYSAQIPLYFIGERLANSTTNLTAAFAAKWTSLLHLQSARNQGGDGTVTIDSGINHPVTDGRFGAVLSFPYPPEVDETTQTGSDQVLLASSASADVLVAYQDPATGVRTVSQNVLVVDKSSAPDSIDERHRLFLNAVWWLLRKPLCGLTDIAISESAPTNVVGGTPFTLSLAAQRSGECEPTGVVVTDTLPSGLTLVAADTPQGTWSQNGATVTFHLGLMQEVLVPLTITVVPNQVGSVTNIVSIRCNEREQNLQNNSASLAIEIGR